MQLCTVTPVTYYLTLLLHILLKNSLHLVINILQNFSKASNRNETMPSY